MTQQYKHPLKLYTPALILSKTSLFYNAHKIKIHLVHFHLKRYWLIIETATSNFNILLKKNAQWEFCKFV